MGCSNTTNNKKPHSIKSQKIGNEQKNPNKGDSAGTNEGKSNSEEKPRDSNINNKENLISYNNGVARKEIITLIEEDENKEIPKGCAHVKVEADTIEQLFPVWIERGKKVKIYVRGRWSLLPEYGMADCKGHANFNYKHRDLHIGALVGRIQGGNYFPVVNGMILESEISGPIYLFANNSRFAIQPTGILDVFLENAKINSQEEIETKLGWDIKELDTTRDHEYLSQEEKKQIIFLNKIKVNPKLFANQYLVHLVDSGESYREIYQKLQHYPVSKLLRPSRALYLAAKDHAADIGENGTTGHKSTDGSDLRSRIERYSPNPSYFGENCCYNLKDPLSIVIQMIVDDGFQTRAHRANILNEIYTQVGISIQPHSSYKWTCVQVFGSNIQDKQGLEI